MIDVVELQNEIIMNPEHIRTVLEALNYEGIQDRGKYYSFKNHGGDNLNGCSILKSNLCYQNFSHGGMGSLITLVEENKHTTFKKSLDYIANVIGFKGREYNPSKIVLPFGGFYKKFVPEINESQISLPTYDENILPPADALSLMWLRDGVSLQQQERFGIRLDLNTNKIVIPARNFRDELIGAKFRINDKNIPLDQRWGMFKPYSKSSILWGYSQNYHDIVKKRTVFIPEAEKSVAQMASFGMNLGTAIGGHNISTTQARYIKSFMADRIIVMFDSDVTEEEVVYNCEKLKVNNLIYKPKIGYIYDRSQVILNANDKVSPTDRGYEVFKILATKCVHWIN